MTSQGAQRNWSGVWAELAQQRSASPSDS